MRFLVVVAAARAAEDCTRAVFELRLDAAVARQAQEDVLAGWTMVPRTPTTPSPATTRSSSRGRRTGARRRPRSAPRTATSSSSCSPPSAWACGAFDGVAATCGAPTSSPTSTPSAPPSAAPSRAPLPAPTTRAPTAAPSVPAPSPAPTNRPSAACVVSTLTLEKQGSCDGPSCAILNTFDYATELPPHCAVEAGALSATFEGDLGGAAVVALNATHQGFPGAAFGGRSCDAADLGTSALDGCSAGEVYGCGPATDVTFPVPATATGLVVGVFGDAAVSSCDDSPALSTTLTLDAEVCCLAPSAAPSFEGGACVLDFVAAPSLAPTINVSASSSSDDDDCDEAFLGLCWVPWGALVVAVAGVVFLVCVAGAFAACAGGGAAPKTIETKPTFTPSDAPPPGRPLVPPEAAYPPDGGARRRRAPPGARPPVDAPTYTPVQDFAYRVRGSPRTPAYSAYGLAPAAGHLAPLTRSTPISEFDARRNSWIDPAAPPVNSNRRAGELLPRPPTYATPTYRSPGPYHTPSRPGSSRAPATPLTACSGDRPPPPPGPLLGLDL
ncbi:hypothetical protein JL721_2825 [Aureococcus anophagefferens]|nr:hypothetical protein JL721_2825 [Aureococcus anophagefferens]